LGWIHTPSSSGRHPTGKEYDGGYQAGRRNKRGWIRRLDSQQHTCDVSWSRDVGVEAFIIVEELVKNPATEQISMADCGFKDGFEL